MRFLPSHTLCATPVPRSKKLSNRNQHASFDLKESRKPTSTCTYCTTSRKRLTRLLVHSCLLGARLVNTRWTEERKKTDGGTEGSERLGQPATPPSHFLGWFVTTILKCAHFSPPTLAFIRLQNMRREDAARHLRVSRRAPSLAKRLAFPHFARRDGIIFKQSSSYLEKLATFRCPSSPVCSCSVLLAGLISNRVECRADEYRL